MGWLEAERRWGGGSGGDPDRLVGWLKLVWSWFDKQGVSWVSFICAFCGVVRGFDLVVRLSLL